MSPKRTRIVGCLAIVGGFALLAYRAHIHQTGSPILRGHPIGMMVALELLSAALLGFGVGSFYKRPVLVAIIFAAAYALAWIVIGSIPDLLNAWSASRASS